MRNCISFQIYAQKYMYMFHHIFSRIFRGTFIFFLVFCTCWHARKTEKDKRTRGHPMLLHRPNADNSWAWTRGKMEASNEIQAFTRGWQKLNYLGQRTSSKGAYARGTGMGTEPGLEPRSSECHCKWYLNDWAKCWPLRSSHSVSTTAL